MSGTGFAREGYPVRSLFSIPFAGLNSHGLPTFYTSDGSTTVSGIYFQESDQKELDFLKYEGPTDPTDTGSFGNIFHYKGLTLNVFITYSFGNVVRLDPVFKKSYNDLTSTPKEFKNRWMVAGDEFKTDIPTIATQRQNWNDTDLKVGLSNLSLKLQATNLFLIYADKKLNGQDPEFFNTGGVAVPVPKQFTLTLRLGI